jgi:hypothetical protein
VNTTIAQSNNLNNDSGQVTRPAPGPSTWLSKPEPGPVEPADDADEKTVALYLDELDAAIGLTWRDTVRYCQKRFGARSDFDLGVVLERLALRRQLAPVRHQPWLWVVVPGLPKSAAFCPRTIWLMDKYSGNVFSISPPCDNWRCWSQCAEDKAERVITQACPHFVSVDAVWHEVFPYDDKLHDWLRQRRQRCHGGVLWVRRFDDDTVHVYATADLSSRERPNLGQWLEPLDALNRLIETTLALPGVQDRRWLGTWNTSSDARKSSGRHISLGTGPKDVFWTADKNARDALENVYGVGALDRFSPDEIDTIWVPLLRAEIDKQWTIYMAAKTSGD